MLHLKKGIMKKTVLLFVISFTFLLLSFSQNNRLVLNEEIYSQHHENEKFYIENITNNIPANYNGVWDFFPVYFHISVGSYIPIGKLANFYNPGVQLGFGVGLIASKIRLEFGIMPRYMNNKKEIEIYSLDTIVKTNAPEGGSIGGWVSYEIFKNKSIYTELVSGVSSELLSIPNEKDPLIKTIGFSFGISSLINKFGKQNVGIRVLYNYAAYNKDNVLKSDLGGQFLTLSLTYSFPERGVY